MIQYWKKIFQDSWTVYTKNFNLVMSAFFIILLPILLIPIIISISPMQIEGDINSNKIWETIFLSFTFSELSFVISMNILMTGLYIGMLDILYNVTSGKKAVIKQLWGKFYCIPKVILPDLLIGILMFIIGVSSLTMIINLIYRLVFFYYTLIIVIENKGMADSINKSFNIVKNNIIIIIQFILIVLLMAVFGFIFPILFFVLIPFCVIIYICIYLQISKI